MDDPKRKLAKIESLLENPGRIFFVRGEYVMQESDPGMPDSYSPEYYYLLQQKARLQLLNAIPVGMTFNPVRLALWLARTLKYYLRLKTVNALVDSYINEFRLIELSRKSVREPDAPNRDPQTG